MKVLFTIAGNHISPRLDMTREILIVEIENEAIKEPPKTILLDKSSAEDLCSFIIKEEIPCVVCGGIEDKHYKYLTWKKTRVIDSVIGPYQDALDLLLKGGLTEHLILPGARDTEAHNDRA